MGASLLSCIGMDANYNETYGLGIVTTNDKGKFEGKILVANTIPKKTYYSVPNSTQLFEANFIFEPMVGDLVTNLNNACWGAYYSTGIKVNAINDPAD